MVLLQYQQQGQRIIAHLDSQGAARNQQPQLIQLGLWLQSCIMQQGLPS